jgi:hypothetical protein
MTRARIERLPLRIRFAGPGLFALLLSLASVQAGGAQQQGAQVAQAQTQAQAQARTQGQSSGGSTQGQQESRQEMMARVLQSFERRVLRELGLTREQGAFLATTFTQFQTSRGALMRDRFQLRRDIERLVEGGSGTDADAQRLIDRMRGLRARELDLQRQEEDQLLRVLTPMQLLHLHHMREEFGESIRRLEVQEHQRRGPGGGSTPSTSPSGRSGG